MIKIYKLKYIQDNITIYIKDINIVANQLETKL